MWNITMQYSYKHICLSTSLIIAAISIVVVLTLFSNQATNQRNGFRRAFFNKTVLLTNSLKVPKTLRSMCGNSDRIFYFETNIPGKILKSDHSLKTTGYINLPVRLSDTITSLFSTYIDSPLVYIMAGNLPAIIMFNLTTKAESVYHFPKNNFTRSVVTGESNFILRSYKKIAGKWEQEFIKLNAIENTITEEKNVSIKRGDAGFSTDGLLHYDVKTHRVLYVNYYINNFICLDTNLNLVYQSHTIDTTGTYQTEANTLGKAKYSRVTNTSPIRNVNLQSCVSDGKLYINSALIADNETRTSFMHNSVIDVYNIMNGLYEGSFYIPSYKGEQLKEFTIYHNRIIVLYPKHIAIYSM
jgi:hypothetical protein